MKQVSDNHKDPGPLFAGDLPPPPDLASWKVPWALPQGQRFQPHISRLVVQRKLQVQSFPPLQKEPLLPRLVLILLQIPLPFDPSTESIPSEDEGLRTGPSFCPKSTFPSRPRYCRAAPRLGSRLAYPCSRPGSGCPRPIQAADRRLPGLGQRPPGPTRARRSRLGFLGGPQDER